VHEPACAELITRIDGHEDRWAVMLPEGVSPERRRGNWRLWIKFVAQEMSLDLRAGDFTFAAHVESDRGGKS
jgi:hypothetical protein